jgi:5-methylcytosine-specific restriction endonuclease McrA
VDVRRSVFSRAHSSHPSGEEIYTHGTPTGETRGRATLRADYGRSSTRERDSLTGGGIRSRATKNPRHTWAWQKLRRTILPKGKLLPCWICGAPATEVDHVVPLATGGTDHPANLRPACRHCNRSRGAKSVETWRRERAQPRSVFSRRPARIW